jgi:hypothetical protein
MKEEIKILRVRRDDEELEECNSCNAYGVNYCKITLFENFCIYVNLCDNCLKKFKSSLKWKND